MLKSLLAFNMMLDIFYFWVSHGGATVMRKEGISRRQIDDIILPLSLCLNKVLPVNT